MGIFGKLFGGSKKPDDYYLASSIASTIDAFISSQGLEDLIKGGWTMELRKDWGISLIRTEGREGSRAAVRLDDLSEWVDFKKIRTDSLMGDSPLGYMATDKLAMAILRKMKEQLGG